VGQPVKTICDSMNFRCRSVQGIFANESALAYRKGGKHFPFSASKSSTIALHDLSLLCNVRERCSLTPEALYHDSLHLRPNTGYQMIFRIGGIVLGDQVDRDFARKLVAINVAHMHSRI
jgi:hypothetical protein